MQASIRHANAPARLPRPSLLAAEVDGAFIGEQRQVPQLVRVSIGVFPVVHYRWQSRRPQSRRAPAGRRCGDWCCVAAEAARGPGRQPWGHEARLLPKVPPLVQQSGVGTCRPLRRADDALADCVPHLGGRAPPLLQLVPANQTAGTYGVVLRRQASAAGRRAGHRAGRRAGRTDGRSWQRGRWASRCERDGASAPQPRTKVIVRAPHFSSCRSSPRRCRQPRCWRRRCRSAQPPPAGT